MNKQFMLILSEVLEAKNITKYRLSKLSNTDYTVISRYCKNKISKYNKDVLLRICLALECEVGDIIKIREQQDAACQESD